MQPASSSPGTEIDAASLIKEHQAGVWRYLRALGCEASLADDLTQETFLAVLQRPLQDLGPVAVGAYLRRVAFNLNVTHHRRSGKVVAVENLEQLAAEWNRVSRDDTGEALLEALKECLAGLAPRAREALEMRFRDQETREAIAEMLKITEHGAKNLMQRAKQQLKTCIEKRLNL